MNLDHKTGDLILTTFEAIQEIKGQDIIGIDLSQAESYTDFILIVSGGSGRQVSAIADNILKRIFEKLKLNPLGIEGYEQAEWILIDFGDIVVHIFLKEIRDEYHLEDMWLNLKPIAEAQIARHVKAVLLPSKKPRTARKSRPKS